MKPHPLDTARFRYNDSKHFAHAKTPTLIEPFYTDKTDRAARLSDTEKR